MVEFLWLEITGKCQLACAHCYAGSGPGGDHGWLAAKDWAAVIGEAAALGVTRVQFIGGEPALHPALPELIRAALDAGLGVEVFTNLVHVPAQTWDAYLLPGVSLATSWYTDDPGQHAAITGRPTWHRTAANIAVAVRRGIPLRAGVIAGVIPGQRSAEAVAMLAGIGVAEIATDQVRGFGRGTIADPSQACGRCGRGIAAVLPDGSVTPCPMTRWRVAGNVADASLGDLLGASLATAAAGLGPATANPCSPTCVPDSYCNPMCTPGACRPRI
jgi:MoaA/NifB/PqqE/SkfB family radical SAM enzyme